MEEEDDGDDDDVVDAAATAEADVPMGWGLRTNAPGSSEPRCPASSLHTCHICLAKQRICSGAKYGESTMPPMPDSIYRCAASSYLDIMSFCDVPMCSSCSISSSKTTFERRLPSRSSKSMWFSPSFFRDVNPRMLGNERFRDLLEVSRVAYRRLDHDPLLQIKACQV